MIALSNNGIMHLFSNVKYEIGGQEIESMNHPGVAGVIMGLAKFPFEYSLGTGMLQCWSPQTSESALMDPAFARQRIHHRQTR